MAKPIITKDHFVACINVLQEGDDMARRINRVVHEYNRDDWINGYAFSDSPAETKLIETLELALGDKEHWISWWCFEADYGRDPGTKAEIKAGDKYYVLDSPQKLYDFLVEN